MEKLANLCEQEAEKLVKTLDIAEGDAISVIFLQYQVPDSLNLSVWEYSVGREWKDRVRTGFLGVNIVTHSRPSQEGRFLFLKS